MILTLILVFAALATILVLVRAARGQSVAITRLEDLQGRTTAIDMAAFRNLVDPQEEKFLRDNLPPQEFSSIQRQRTRAAIFYVRCAAQNAAILLRLGEAARHHSNPQLVQTAQQMAEDAIRLRLYAFMVLLQLYVGLLVPGLHVSPSLVLDRYQRLTDALAYFTRLQHPGLATRISSTL